MLTEIVSAIFYFLGGKTTSIPAIFFLTRSLVREIEYGLGVFSTLPDADPNAVERAPQTVKRSSWRSPFARFLVAWSSTVPDAVGVPGLRYVVSKQDGNRRRYNLMCFYLWATSLKMISLHCRRKAFQFSISL